MAPLSTTWIRVAQACGIVLVGASLLKIVGFASVRDWISFAFGLPEATSSIAVILLIGVELAVGTLSICRPALVAPVAIVLFSSFLVVHAIMYLVPDLKWCPCLGDVVPLAFRDNTRLVLTLYCAAALAANIVLFLMKSERNCHVENS